MSSSEVVFQRNAKGRPVQILGVNIDTTKRKEMEERLKRSEKELNEANITKDKFFSIIGHDLKNPIGGFIGLSEELLTNFRQLSISQIKEISYALHESSRHLYKLLDNLLQWSTIQRDMIRLKIDKINLRDVAGQSLNLYRINAGDKKIELINDIDKRFDIEADPNMTDLVFRNLISNAIKFSPMGGIITLDARRLPDDFIEISVADTGIGIDPDRIEKLFDIGSLDPSTGTANEKGTGLGLILCKEVIEKMGGRLFVDSIPGEGTTFRFTLPGYE
jgi:signal transduction histidine kinase